MPFERTIGRENYPKATQANRASHRAQREIHRWRANHNLRERTMRIEIHSSRELSKPRERTKNSES